MKHRSKTILLVEDQIIAAAPAINVLKNAGYYVIYVMRGEDAVIIIKAGVPIDLVVMDIDLGHGICGMTASEIISSIIKIPILFFTSRPEQDITEKIGTIFSVNYLSKKNSPASLLASIEKTIFSFNFLNETCLNESS